MSSLDIFREHVQNALKHILKETQLTNSSIEVKDGSKVGDGFQSELTSVTFKGVRNDGSDTEIELNLVCKLPPKDENRRKASQSDFVFGREIFFYAKVLPTFIDFQREKLIPEENQFRAYSKCYAALGVSEESDYAIIMDDLRPKGFQMWNKTEPTTLGNIHIVLEQIGKFHAISFAMKDQRPNEFAQFKTLTNILDKFIESSSYQSILISSLKRAENALRADHHKKIMSKMQTNIVNYSRSSESEFAVVSHGDLWNNNIMYYFNENNVAKDVRFIDWQMMRYASPAIDVAFHIFTVTDKTLRDADYMNLLRIYHDSLSRMLRDLGSDADKLFTFKNFLDEMKEYGNYAFLVLSLLLSLSLTDFCQIANKDETCDEIASGKHMQNLLPGLSDSAAIEYENRINDAIGDLVDLGYFKELN